MARPRKLRTDLPECVYFRSGAYYYVTGGVWTRLGKTSFNEHDLRGKVATDMNNLESAKNLLGHSSMTTPLETLLGKFLPALPAPQSEGV